MATSAANARTISAPPTPVAWAVYIIVASNVLLTIVGFLPIPGQDDIPVAALIVGSVLAIASVVLCWWLWQMKRWAAIAITALTAINAASSVPAFLDPPSGTVVAVVIAGIVTTIIPIWLMWQSTARRAYT